MTKADRLAEIDDQAGYLTTLLSSLQTNCPPTARLTVLGFSQGTATASRWLAREAAQWRPDQLVLWAGDFPTDIDAGAARQLLTGLPVALVCGDQDEYVSLAKLQEQADTLRQHGAVVNIHSFTGGHALNPDLLRRLHATPLLM